LKEVRYEQSNIEIIARKTSFEKRRHLWRATELL